METVDYIGWGFIITAFSACLGLGLYLLILFLRDPKDFKRRLTEPCTRPKCNHCNDGFAPWAYGGLDDDGGD